MRKIIGYEKVGYQSKPIFAEHLSKEDKAMEENCKKHCEKFWEKRNHKLGV